MESINLSDFMEMLQEALKKQSNEERKINEEWRKEDKQEMDKHFRRIEETMERSLKKLSEPLDRDRCV